MRLRTRFSIVLAVFCLLLTIVTVLVARTLLLANATRIDTDRAERMLIRGVRMLQAEGDALRRLATDWASWDDTYAFMRARNPEYIDSNLVEGTLGDLRLNVMAYIGLDREPAVSVLLDARGFRHGTLPAWLRDRAQRAGGLLDRLERDGALAGFVAEGETLWLLAAAPILTSRDEGPHRGALLMARRIDAIEKERLAGLVHESIRLAPAVSGWSSGRSRIRASTPMTMEAATAMDDLLGSGRIMLGFTLPRVAFAQVSLSLLTLTAWVVACGAAVTLFSFGVLDRWVLRSVSESIAALKAGSRPDEPGSALPLVAKVHADEIGELIDAVNAMLVAHDASQASVRASEARYRGLVEATPEAIAAVDAQGDILFTNRAFAQLAGRGEDELRGASIGAILPREAAEAIETALAAAKAGQPGRLGPFEVPDAGGVTRWFMLVVTQVPAASGRSGYGLLCMHDITDRLNAEREADRRREEAQQAQKLAALGTLVAGIAHEINNPNGVVNLNMHVLRRSVQRLCDALESTEGSEAARSAELLRAKQELQDIAAETLEASDRIAGLVSSLKSFAQPVSDASAEDVAIHDIVQRAIEWVRHDLKESGCRVECAIAPGLPPVKGHRQQLLQVVINLLQNACNAAARPGTRIRVSAAASGDSETETVALAVRDEGRGIPAEDIEHVLDPFFTTRRGEGGTGLGLSISAAIVRAHGGRLMIQSGKGEGTVVTAMLPVAEESRNA